MKKVKPLPPDHELCAFGRKHILQAIKKYKKNGEPWLKEKGYLTGNGKKTTFVVDVDDEETLYQVKPLARVAYKIATGKLPSGYNTTVFEKRLKELNFSVRKIWEQPTSDNDEFAERVELALKSARKAGKSAPPPKGQMNPKWSSVHEHRVNRLSTVVAWVLEQAKGVCEVCKKPASFKRDNGTPYLEVHHVKPLAKCGPDTPCNAVACCPDCHRRLHYATNRHKIRKKIISRISRLHRH